MKINKAFMFVIAMTIMGGLTLCYLIENEVMNLVFSTSILSFASGATLALIIGLSFNPKRLAMLGWVDTDNKI